MAYHVTVDAGTSNTRVFLWTQDGILAGRAARNIGVRNTAIDGNNRQLKAAIRECMEEAVEKASATLGAVLEGEVKAVQDSGCLSLDKSTKCYLAGNEVINRALFDVFEQEGCFDHVVCHADSGIPLSSLGARLIAAQAGVL